MGNKLTIKISSGTYAYEYNFDDPDKLKELSAICKGFCEEVKDPSFTMKEEDLNNLGPSVELLSCLGLLASHSRTCIELERRDGTIENV